MKGKHTGAVIIATLRQTFVTGVWPEETATDGRTAIMLPERSPLDFDATNYMTFLL